MGLIIEYRSGYLSLYLSCTRYRGYLKKKKKKIKQTLLVEKSNCSNMIISLNYFHPIMNEWITQAKEMTKSLPKLLQTLTNYSLIGLISSCVRRTTKFVSMGMIFYIGLQTRNFVQLRVRVNMIIKMILKYFRELFC